ncbi:hypothetical protein CTAYLR_003563 [Chrysophaeum taylorii]|uniref:Phosphatidate cytidylyltransferase, mitochondrial n=1 Tax=Chrysophaeum taylorii TaxID=2483200 RepID=A0AAD7ULK8_9STRA|nr:hypothetical protein CTAYLR_003563 [Chrysophaeum taylorii]
MMIQAALSEARLPPWRLGFAYGSGVLDTSRMLDVIITVDDPVSWHAENLAANRSHYSVLASLGPRAVARTQAAGPGVYFNAYVPLATTWPAMKYGVVSTAALFEDLRTWRWLYLAGRLHKPVVGLAGFEQLAEAQAVNLRAALAAALLLLPPRFDAETLFSMIASLSYEGDVRFAVGAEDAAKIDTIVGPNLAAFRDLFDAPIAAAVGDGVLTRRSDDAFEQRPDNASLLLARLPPALRAATDLGAALRRLVRRSSAAQTLKGLFTAGPGRSFRYVAAKLAKGKKRPVTVRTYSS